MKKGTIVAGLFALMTTSVLFAMAQGQENSKPTSTSNTNGATHGSSAPTNPADEATLRIEGEKRFRANCGRCHMPPHKFPPRIMATAIRHMRVRAMLTDEDMRLILKYMTQ